MLRRSTGACYPRMGWCLPTSLWPTTRVSVLRRSMGACYPRTGWCSPASLWLTATIVLSGQKVVGDMLPTHGMVLTGFSLTNGQDRTRYFQVPLLSLADPDLWFSDGLKIVWGSRCPPSNRLGRTEGAGRGATLAHRTRSCDRPEGRSDSASYQSDPRLGASEAGDCQVDGDRKAEERWRRDGAAYPDRRRQGREAKPNDQDEEPLFSTSLHSRIDYGPAKTSQAADALSRPAQSTKDEKLLWAENT